MELCERSKVWTPGRLDLQDFVSEMLLSCTSHGAGKNPQDGWFLYVHFWSFLYFDVRAPVWNLWCQHPDKMRIVSLFQGRHNACLCNTPETRACQLSCEQISLQLWCRWASSRAHTQTIFITATILVGWWAIWTITIPSCTWMVHIDGERWLGLNWIHHTSKTSHCSLLGSYTSCRTSSQQLIMQAPAVLSKSEGNGDIGIFYIVVVAVGRRVLPHSILCINTYQYRLASFKAQLVVLSKPIIACTSPVQCPWIWMKAYLLSRGTTQPHVCVLMGTGPSARSLGEEP